MTVFAKKWVNPEKKNPEHKFVKFRQIHIGHHVKNTAKLHTHSGSQTHSDCLEPTNIADSVQNVLIVLESLQCVRLVRQDDACMLKQPKARYVLLFNLNCMLNE